LVRGFSEKIKASMLSIYERVLSINQVEVYAVKIETMEYFHGMLNKHIELVERRCIRYLIRIWSGFTRVSGRIGGVISWWQVINEVLSYTIRL
jgi:hypothetical protein